MATVHFGFIKYLILYSRNLLSVHFADFQRFVEAFHLLKVSVVNEHDAIGHFFSEPHFVRNDNHRHTLFC